jgi:hypothetical protein
MNLREFVSTVLTDIINGVRDAQEEAGKSPDSGAIVAPGTYLYPDGTPEEGSRPQNVEFDVAVTSEEGKSSKKGLGIVVASIGIGAQGQSEAKSSSVSRIKFIIPLVLPRPKAL